MYCTECGTILSDTAKFCSSCGSIVSTLKEVTTPEKKQLDRELRKSIKNNQEDNDFTRSIVLIGFAFFCLYLIFKPGPLGVSMFDLAMVGDCTDHLLVSCEVRDERRFYVTILGIFSFLCFASVNGMRRPRGNRRKQYHNPILSKTIIRMFLILIFLILLAMML